MPRVLAVCAAILLVGSVALASLLPSDISLRAALNVLDPAAPERLQAAIVGLFGHGFWDLAIVPLLIRPVWLLPVGLGLICVGGAVTALSNTSARTKQRRS